MTNPFRGKALLLAVVIVTTGLALTLGSAQGMFPASRTAVAVASPPLTKASAGGIENLKMSVLLSDSGDEGQTAPAIEQTDRVWLWPLLLFLPVFAGGWLAARLWQAGAGKEDAVKSRTDEPRSAARTPPQAARSVPPVTDHAATQNPGLQRDPDLARRVMRRDKRISMLKRRIKELKNELAQNNRAYQTRDSVLSDELQLQERIRTQTAIISALEDLIGTNRHKWLHRDATEAHLQAQITALTADLELAMRILDKRQRDVS